MKALLAAVLVTVSILVVNPPTTEAKSFSQEVKAARAYALEHVGRTQFRCLDRLWMRESGWNPHSHNRWSGAHGIPQAVPGSKMASEGADWWDNPLTQVRWGLKYIHGRYTTPCGALAHSDAYGWY